MLFYGPPGSGKTTTIINLIVEYQEKHNEKNKGLMIHLNASDERGVDVVRSQIHSFVKSKTLLGNGMKFIVLDEVDYMTKNAQQALRYLIQECHKNVRIFLICNYISKIDDSLQSEFVKIKFNNLPRDMIFNYLHDIVTHEKITISDEVITNIITFYESDVRSMINFLQTNQTTVDCKIMGNDLWEPLWGMIESKTNINLLAKHLTYLSRTYNNEKTNLLKEFIHYLILQQRIEPAMIYLFSEIIRNEIPSDLATTYILLLLLNKDLNP
jgi:replication factor C subunit 3/5